MPRVRQAVEQADLRAKLFKLCHVRGYTQQAAAKVVGLTPGRVSQLLKETIHEWRAKVVEKYSPYELVSKRLEQLADIREEAWLAWEKSKENAECTTEEKQLKTIYRTATLDGKQVKVPHGEKLKVVKAVKEVRSRLPDCAYLNVILKCLQDESRLEGLTEEFVVRVINNNVLGNQTNVAVSWDAMTSRPPDRDDVERQIAEGGGPECVPGGWSPAEAAEMGDDEPEHLNGDGGHG